MSLNTPQEFQDFTDQLETDGAKLHKFVHGTDTEEVATEGGNVDTIAKLAAWVQEQLATQLTGDGNLAPKDSPQLTGTPTAPTAAPGTNTTQIATMAAVIAEIVARDLASQQDITDAIDALVGAAPGALDTLNELAAALGDDPNFAGSVTTSLAGKQPLNNKLTALSGLAVAAGDLFVGKGDGTLERLPIGDEGTALTIRDDAPIWLPSREVLSADLDLYLDPAGNDTNDGSSGAPLATLQAAIDIAAQLDSSIFDVNIWLADGTYEDAAGGALCKSMLGSGSVYVRGNPAARGNVIVRTTTAAVAGNFWSKQSITPYIVSDLTLESTATTAFALWANGGKLNFDNVTLGSGFAQMLRVDDYGKLTADGDFEIAGDAWSWLVNVQGSARVQGVTVTLTGTPAFSAGVSCSDGGVVLITGTTFSGAATGGRYSISTNGVLRSSGAGTASTYFPGSSDGIADTGGVQT